MVCVGLYHIASFNRVKNKLNDINIQDKSEYSRVTEILSPFSGLDKVPKDILANAARRGTKVHDACESIVKGLGE